MMIASESIVVIVGLLAQLCFAIRQITQWWATEKTKVVQSPISFWTFSLIGSSFFFIYGILQEDFAIVLGQLLNYYIFCRNLYFKGSWYRYPRFLKGVILCIPLMVLGYLFAYQRDIFESVLDNEDIKDSWLMVGTIGYLIFTLRFFYQWYVSERLRESKLPAGFFILSFIGSLMIIAYGIYREDWILIIGYLGGLVVYIRNLMIHFQQSRQ